MYSKKPLTTVMGNDVAAAQVSNPIAAKSPAAGVRSLPAPRFGRKRAHQVLQRLHISGKAGKIDALIGTTR